MIRAERTTCGRKTFPSPKSSPTLDIPPINGPSMSDKAFSNPASFKSSFKCESSPRIKACDSRSSTFSFRHSSISTSDFRLPASALSEPVMASLIKTWRAAGPSPFSTRSASLMMALALSGMPAVLISMAGFTMAMSSPASTASSRKMVCIALRSGLFPRNAKDRLLSPPLTLALGKCSLIHFTARMKSRA